MWYILRVVAPFPMPFLRTAARQPTRRNSTHPPRPIQSNDEDKISPLSLLLLPLAVLCCLLLLRLYKYAAAAINHGITASVVVASSSLVRAEKPSERDRRIRIYISKNNQHLGGVRVRLCQVSSSLPIHPPTSSSSSTNSSTSSGNGEFLSLSSFSVFFSRDYVCLLSALLLGMLPRNKKAVTTDRQRE